MPSEPLFTNFFGAGVTQTATQIIVLKNDLVAPVGLVPSYDFTPAAENRAEQTALAFILKWLRNQDQSTDSQFVIKSFEQSLEFRFNKWQRRYVSEIEIFQDDTLSTFPNPNLI
jgi:ribonuclease HI